MIKALFVEVIPQSEPLPPKQEELGYAYIAEPMMERKVPVPNSNGTMPPPLLISIAGDRFFVIGFTYNIPDLTGSTQDEPAESVHVIMVQRAMPKSGLVRAGAGDMDKIRSIIPEPGGRMS